MYKLYHKKRICPVCGTEFQPKNMRGVYCSPLCRWHAFSMRKSGSETLLSNAKQTEIQRKKNDEADLGFIAKPITEKALQDKSASDTNAELRQSTNAKPTQDEMVSCTNAKPTLTQRKEDKESLPESITNPFTEKELQDKSVSDPNANQTESANGKQTQDKRDSDPGEQTQVRSEMALDKGCFAPGPEKSEFITAISEKVEERGYDERFINPLQYWPRQEAELISKINKYLRCLLESTLKLSRYRNIPATDLLNLANAYTHVVYSQDFEKSGHPYYETLKSLHRKLSQVYRNFKNRAKLRLVLSREDKVELITMLHEIGNSVPLYKFSELFKGAKR
jgi:hypothetical protein